MRRAAKVDANQAAIVSALRSVGASVWIIGLPVDLLIGAHGKTVLAEVKTMVGKRAPRAADYTPLQEGFMQLWRGGTVATLTDVDGALRLVAAMRDSPYQRWPGLEPERQRRIDSTGLATLEGL